MQFKFLPNALFSRTISNLVSKSILAAELIKMLTLSKILYISLSSVIIFALLYKNIIKLNF